MDISVIGSLDQKQHTEKKCDVKATHTQNLEKKQIKTTSEKMTETHVRTEDTISHYVYYRFQKTKGQGKWN